MPTVSALDDTVPGIQEACGTTRPFLAVTRFAHASGGAVAPGALAIEVLRDRSASESGARRTLATYEQVGSVFGLAFDASRDQLYAAAYQKRAAPHGPGGPGAIYQIDAASGAVRVWARIDAGPDQHDWRADNDELGAEWVGVASLGGLALSEDRTHLCVANLYRSRIECLAVPDGRLLGVFRHGARSADWRGRARLFALAFRGDWLYHGIVEARFTRWNRTPLAGVHIYRSRIDGSDMTEQINWQLSGAPNGRRSWWSDGDFLLANIAFRSDGAAMLGLRSRGLDTNTWSASEGCYGEGSGDLVTLEQTESGWEPSLTWNRDLRASAGSIVAMPGFDVVAGPALTCAQLDPAPGTATTPGASWNGDLWWTDVWTQQVIATAPVVAVHGPDAVAPDATLGGIEVLCPRSPNILDAVRAMATADAAMAGTATAEIRASRATASATSVAATLTADAVPFAGTAVAVRATGLAAAAATAAAAPRNLDRIRASCRDGREYFATTVFARGGDETQMMRQASLVAFDGAPDEQIPLVDELRIGAVYGLAFDWRREQIYAAAYRKRMAVGGPGGSGAIYRVHLADGSVELWRRLYAGEDARSYDADSDAGAIPGVGRSALGDIDIAADGSELYVVNLFDRRIYRYGLPDGELLGWIDHGATREPWASEAIPMGLGVRDGFLYHAVVRSTSAFRGITSALDPTALEGVVYRSLPNGNEMAEVARWGLENRWAEWTDDERWVPQALVSDLEWSLTGDMIVGVRDRCGDTQLGYMAHGDILRARRISGETSIWAAPDTGPEFFDDETTQPEAAWGGLAMHPVEDLVVSSVLDPEWTMSGGATWLANATGRSRQVETLYRTSTSHDLTFAKSAGLGDIEALCPAPTTPQSTHTPSIEPTPTPTSTPSATASPTDTQTHTATVPSTPRPTARNTPRPTPIYLPLVLDEQCAADKQHADVALVIDTSSSMLEPARLMQTKLDAAVHAARGLLDLLQLAGGDQASIIVFNANATVVQALTHERVLLDAALSSLTTADLTRLHHGVETGRRELGSARRRAGNVPVMIVLTDGRANPDPVSLAVAEAARAKGEGIVLFTIGLGDDLDLDALREMASEAGGAYHAPSAEHLAAIYRQIAVDIPCAPREFWPLRRR